MEVPYSEVAGTKSISVAKILMISWFEQVGLYTAHMKNHHEAFPWTAGKSLPHASR